VTPRTCSGLYLAAIALGGMLGALLVARFEERGVPAGRVLAGTMAVAAVFLAALAAGRPTALRWRPWCSSPSAGGLRARDAIRHLPHAPDCRIGLAIGIWGAATPAGALLGSLLLARAMDDVGVDAALLAAAGATLLFAAIAAIAATCQRRAGATTTA
jgi:predicted MFS family arabinose efflux permease